eukprot:TRINITY_DN14329_c0_g1_i1.p1 TRINITY_DN14329_c0_g1~~TRINITY_DN14329_c0_g1_i1.p1  ORF type:complete len:311 (-),score=42.12 TRINITY_DN14329_c0_g1_i1:124-1056(-)
MHAALHSVGLGPLRGVPQSAEPPSGVAGCQLELAPCDPRVLSPFYAPPVLDPEEMRHNLISRKPDGDFYCALCWKSPPDEWRVKEHLMSKDHLRRMSNEQYRADPLACVPSPHREFTVNLDGWATCTLCNKKMDESHWHSAKHTQYLNWALVQRSAVCNVAQLPLPLVDSPPPLPQPPPPPERPGVGCGAAAGGSVIAGGKLFPAASDTDAASEAQTVRGVQDRMLAASGAPREPAASQFTQLPFAPVATTSTLLQGPAPRHHQQHPWGSRGPNDEVLNDDEWNQFLQEFDKRHAGEWWPIDTEWEFYDM